MRRLLYAFRFLTVLPLPFREGEDLPAVARSAALFPLAGLGIGGALLGTAAAGLIRFSPAVTGILVLVIWTVSTGGLHLDGLSDLADGIGGGRTREQKLAIMKDSRVGAFGVLALICLLALKGVLLADLAGRPSFLLFRTLLFVPAAARGILTAVIFLFPNARPGGMGSFFKEHLRFREMFLALLLALAAGWFCLGPPALAIFGGALGLSLAGGLGITRSLGGLTGDAYGALCETAEVLLLLGVLGWAGPAG